MTATGLLRERSQGGEARVETVELFYDLVFVFAITQLSHRLVHHPTIHGAIETGILFVAIWSSWVNTAWVTNWLDPNRRRVRFMLFALMAGGLVVSMSIPDAFAEKAVPFAIAYVAVELGRSAFTALALRRHDHGNYLNFIRILVWQALSGALWIAGAFDAEARLWLWAGAMALWTAGPAALLFADTLAHHDGQLTYMPDFLLGDDPEAVKREMTEQLTKLLADAQPFDTLLFAHGSPVAEGGRELLADFVGAQARA